MPGSATGVPVDVSVAFSLLSAADYVPGLCQAVNEARAARAMGPRPRPAPRGGPCRPPHGTRDPPVLRGSRRLKGLPSEGVDMAPRARCIFRRHLCGSNSVVECNLAKVEVAGSNPVSRSLETPDILSS